MRPRVISCLIIMNIIIIIMFACIILRCVQGLLLHKFSLLPNECDHKCAVIELFDCRRELKALPAQLLQVRRLPPHKYLNSCSNR
jgi:hypothetical protein